MLSKDEDALICDLAETYNVYDYESLPVQRVATLAIGLRGDSRIVMKMTGAVFNRTDFILSLIADYTALNVWMKTKDGHHGRNRPKPLREIFSNANKEKDVVTFDTPEEFELARQEILRSEVAHG